MYAHILQDDLKFDPTPWKNPYPQPKWHTWRQLTSREYGKNVVSLFFLYNNTSQSQ